MEWLGILSAALLIAGYIIFKGDCRKRCVYTVNIGNQTKSKKHSNTDSPMSEVLDNISICNKSSERTVKNGYKSKKLR